MAIKSRTKKRAAAKPRKSKTVAKAIKTLVKILPATDVPEVGAYWPDQHGFYMGIIKGEGSMPNSHVVLPCGKDRKVPTVKGVSYGSYGTRIGADSKNDSASNTDKMLAAGSSAAKAIRKLDADFQLPAEAVSMLVFANGREHLPTEWFLTSTEVGADGAFNQSFGSGYAHWGSKYNAWSAFPVRLVPIGH